MFKDFKPEIKLSLLIALIAVIISVAGILLLREIQAPPPTPQQEVLDTSTWQTYRNDEFGFEVKYPKDWKIFASNEHFILVIRNQSLSAHFGVFIPGEEESFPVASLTGVDEMPGLKLRVHNTHEFSVATYGADPDEGILEEMFSTFKSSAQVESEEKRAAAIRNLSPEDKEILKLLDIREKYFIELARIEFSPPYKYQLPFSEFTKMLKDEKFQNIISQSMNITLDKFLYFQGANIEKQGSRELTYTDFILLGPFENQNDANQHLSLAPLDLPTASVRQGLPDSINAFAIYREKDGLTLFPYNVFNGVDYIQDKENQRLFVIDPGGFEHEKFPDTLLIIDGKRKRITSIPSVNGMVLLPDKKHLLIVKYFSVEKTEGVDEEKLREVVKEVGVSPEVVRENIYGLGGKPSLGTFALFKLNLETLEQESLQLMGGRGGIFMVNTGEIFITDHGNVGFSEGPYFRFDQAGERLIPMPEDFDNVKQIMQPFGAGQDYENFFSVLANAGTAKLIRLENTFYIEGRMTLEK